MLNIIFIKKMQMKIMKRDHLTSNRMANIFLKSRK